MPAAFTTQYAVQLAEFTNIRVKEAERGEALQPGTLYICPGGQHLRVFKRDEYNLMLERADRRLPAEYRRDPRIGCRLCRPMAIAVILTGMGSDGARGSRLIKVCWWDGARTRRSYFGDLRNAC